MPSRGGGRSSNSARRRGTQRGATGRLVLASLLALGAAPVTADAASGPAFGSLVVFGDSLSDNGNVFRATSLLGNPIPKSPPYFNGRFSNGPVWVEDLAPLIGVPSSRFVDRAFGGALSGAGSSPVPGVKAQVLGYVPANRPPSNGLFVVWGGANDYRADSNPTNPAALVRQTVGNLKSSVSALAAAGARDFLVPNLPNLGNTPEARAKQAADPGIEARLNSLVAQHNALLAQTLGQLRSQIPGSEVTLLDVNSLFRNAIANPARYGLTNVTTPCLLGVAPTVGPSSGACRTPSATAGTLFFDELHPTATGHRLLAQFADATLTATGQGSLSTASRLQGAFLTSQAQTSAIGARLAAVRSGVGPVSVLGPGTADGFAADPAGAIGPQWASADPASDDPMVADLGSQTTRLQPAATSDKPLGIFLYGSHAWGDRSTRVDEEGFTYDDNLVALGADYRLNESLLVGASFGYGWMSTHPFDGGAADENSYKLTAYGSAGLGGWYADGDLGYSFDDYPTVSRPTGFDPTPTAEATTSGHTLSFGATTGYGFDVGPLHGGPFLAGRYTHIAIDGFTEHGAGALDMTVSGQNATSVTGDVGVQVSARLQVGAVAITPKLRLAYEHEFANDPRRAEAFLAGASQTAQPGVGGRDYAVVGAGINLEVTGSVSLIADYEGTLGRSDGRDHSVLGKIEIRF